MVMKKIAPILFFVIICFASRVRGADDKYAKKLIDDLFLEYKTDLRPVNNTLDSINVTFHVFLFQILELDEKNQILTAYLWLRQEWHDAHLKWTPSKYDGLETIRLPSSKIWLPDIVLYNNADEKFTKNMQTNVIIKNNGLVRWDQPAITKTSCDLDVVYFPFDVQLCPFTFGSWTFYQKQLDITPAQTVGNRDDFVDNVEWEVTSMPIKREVKKYGCCPDPYPIIYITLSLERKSMFYIFNLLLPCLFISILAPLIFYLPSESGEKVSLGVTTLLAMTVFQLLVAESMPPSQSLPLIGKYYITTMALMSLSTAATIFVQNVHFCGSNPQPVPKWVKVWILHRLAKFLSIKINTSVKVKDEVVNEKKKSTDLQSVITAQKQIEHQKCEPNSKNVNYYGMNGINKNKIKETPVNGGTTFQPKRRSFTNIQQMDDMYNQMPGIRTISNSSQYETSIPNDTQSRYGTRSSQEFLPRTFHRFLGRETVFDHPSATLSRTSKESVRDDKCLLKAPVVVPLNSSPNDNKNETLASIRRKKFHQMSMYSKSLDLTDDTETPLLKQGTQNTDTKGKFLTLATVTHLNDPDRKSIVPSIHNSTNSVNMGESWSVTSLNKNEPGTFKECLTQKCKCCKISEETNPHYATTNRLTSGYKLEDQRKIQSRNSWGGFENNKTKPELATGEEQTDRGLNENLKMDLLSINNNVQCIADHISRQKNILDTMDEWKNVSRVCDRALMWIFIIVQVLFSTLIICKIL